jgi:hypothetical protein
MTQTRRRLLPIGDIGLPTEIVIGEMGNRVLSRRFGESGHERRGSDGSGKDSARQYGHSCGAMVFLGR